MKQTGDFWRKQSLYFYDFERWPLVVVRYPKELPEPILAQHCLDDQRFHRELSERVWMLVDVSHLTVATARQRATIGESEKIVETLPGNDFIAAQALVIPQVLLRGAFTAVRWFQKRRFEEQVFANEAASIAWLRTRGLPASSP